MPSSTSTVTAPPAAATLVGGGCGRRRGGPTTVLVGVFVANSFDVLWRDGRSGFVDHDGPADLVAEAGPAGGWETPPVRGGAARARSWPGGPACHPGVDNRRVRRWRLRGRRGCRRLHRPV